jgi:hypothetical protein
VCYDPLFFQAARDRDLIPAGIPARKESIRDYLRAKQAEDSWTELQAVVYGEYIVNALPFPGFGEFLARSAKHNFKVQIISHKTEKPYRGPDLNLRQAAIRWLDSQHFLAPSRNGLPTESVFFEDSKEAKMARITACGCDVFVDDLPEFLAEPAFPPETRRVLFDPDRRAPLNSNVVSCASWFEVLRYVEEQFG